MASNRSTVFFAFLGIIAVQCVVETPSKDNDTSVDALSLLQISAVPTHELNFRREKGHEAGSLEVLEEALWDGLDTNTDFLLHDVRSRRSISIPSLPKNSVSFNSKNRTFTSLQIAGMFDTGTNLLGATLHLNFGSDVLSRFCPGMYEEGYHCHWWKHSAPIENSARLTSDTLIVQMVRSPVSSFSAWHKAGYDLEKCALAFGTPCVIKGRSYPAGVTGVWNSYTRGYQDLADTHDNAIIVEYERLVLDPASVVQQIASLLDVPLHEDVQVLTTPAKQHGWPCGRDAAINKITQMSYLQDPCVVNAATKQSLCQGLDTSVVKLHRILVDPPRSYAADCGL